MNSGMLFNVLKNDDEEISIYYIKNKFNSFNSKLLNYEKIDSNISYLNLKCDKIQEKYLSNDTIKASFVRLISNISILEEYILNEEANDRLMFIGSSYKRYGKYTLQNIENTHSPEILLYKVTDIYERDSIDNDVKSYIDKIIEKEYECH